MPTKTYCRSIFINLRCAADRNNRLRTEIENAEKTHTKECNADSRRNLKSKEYDRAKAGLPSHLKP